MVLGASREREIGNMVNQCVGWGDSNLTPYGLEKKAY